MNVTAVLFEGFETLDLFGPVEMLGASGQFEIAFYSPQGRSCHELSGRSR